MLMKVEGIVKNFGGLIAVNEVNFHVNQGEIVGLIGPNGSGKTTLFNLLTGIANPDQGGIFFNDEKICGLPPHSIAQKGIGRTFQGTRVFPHLTVLENVMRGRHCRTTANLWSAILHTSYGRKELRESKKIAWQIIDGLGLGGKKNTPVADLPYGLQAMTGIAIALASEPVLLLLDEPAAGMNPSETKELMVRIQEIRKKKITIFMIEHNMKAIMGTCERIIVLNNGMKIAEGAPQEISQNEQVIQAYLGRGFLA